MAYTLSTFTSPVSCSYPKEHSRLECFHPFSCILTIPSLPRRVRDLPLRRLLATAWYCSQPVWNLSLPPPNPQALTLASWLLQALFVLASCPSTTHAAPLLRIICFCSWGTFTSFIQGDSPVPRILPTSSLHEWQGHQVCTSSSDRTGQLSSFGHLLKGWSLAVVPVPPVPGSCQSNWIRLVWGAARRLLHPS